MNYIASGSSAFFTNLGGILSGISELLIAVGAGIGFIIRTRRGARRERLRAETAASLAAQETKRTLESKLEAQQAVQNKQYEDQIDQLQHANQLLQANNDRLVERILNGGKPKPKVEDDS